MYPNGSGTAVPFAAPAPSDQAQPGAVFAGPPDTGLTGF